MLEINLNATFFLICCLPPSAKSNGKPIYLKKPRVRAREKCIKTIFSQMLVFSFATPCVNLKTFKLMKKGKVEINIKAVDVEVLID